MEIDQLLDPELELSATHLENFKRKGKILWFKNVKGTEFSAVSNLYGNPKIVENIFGEKIRTIQSLIKLKDNPLSSLKNPLSSVKLLFSAFKAIPKKVSKRSAGFKETKISKLPQIKCWEKDGGAFITLPQVMTLSPNSPKNIKTSNIGMYRIQLSGNEYIQDEEIGLHYQLHRGIGVHHREAIASKKPFKVSIFLGGPLAHAVGAVMPLPEGLSEVFFNGVLSGRRFRYFFEDGYCISADADFVITGEVQLNKTKPEGPFGDHLGYYSLTHEFPVMKVDKVYHKTDAVFPFTVVGKPPQEDTQFGALVHQIAKTEIAKQIPGVKSVNAVDQAGVHPLLLAIGSERYTPYKETKAPSELLTIANHILGFGQLSLAKYLFIANQYDNISLDTQDIKTFFIHIFSRINLERDVHFYTNTSIDTLDYSSKTLNCGSKVVFAAVGKPIIDLLTQTSSVALPSCISQFENIFDGVFSMSLDSLFAHMPLHTVISNLEKVNTIDAFNGIKLIVLSDNAQSLKDLNHFLWVTFTKSNPADDIDGLWSETASKHWGCKGPLVIDARKKSHHAPELVMDKDIEEKVEKMLDEAMC